MSIYSGFATRQLEQSYNQLLQLLLVTLCKRLIKFYKNEDCSENGFKKALSSTLGGLKQLELNKYLEPKFSESIKPLEEILYQPKEYLLEKKIQYQNINSQLSEDNSFVKFSNHIPTYKGINQCHDIISPIQLSKQKKRVHSISLTKRKEIEFRQQLLQLEEEQRPTSFFIRQKKKL